MIKKTILFTIALLLIATPQAYGNGEYPSHLTDSDFINVKYSLDAKEVEIGGTLSCEITIDNLTGREVKIHSITFGSLYMGIYKFTQDGKESNSYIIEPFESAVIEFELTVDERIEEVYKKGEEFYIDIQPAVSYTSGWDIYNCDYYETYIKSTPVNITNLEDGSEYIEIEWLDNREYFYYFCEYEWDIENFDIDRTYVNGEQLWGVRYKNISDLDIGRYMVKPGEEAEEYKSISREDLKDKIPESITHTYSMIFEIDGEYYCSAKTREYNVETLKIPDISMQVVEISEDIEKNTKTYEFTVTPTKNKTIKDFCFISSMDKALDGDEESIWIGDFEYGETIKKIHTFDMGGLRDTVNISAGYLLEGVLYLWTIGEYLPEPEHQEMSPIKNYFTYPYLYDYDSHMEHAEYLRQSAEDVIIAETPSFTPTPTFAPVQETATTTPVEIEAVVIKRKNNFQWVYVIIGLIAAGVGAGAVVLIRKVIKNKQDE